MNDAMLDDVLHGMRTHACNLGCLIADELAAMLPGCRSFIADPGVMDELEALVMNALGALRGALPVQVYR